MNILELWVLIRPVGGRLIWIPDNVWTSYESGHSLPQFFGSKEEAADHLKDCISNSKERKEAGWVAFMVKLQLPEQGTFLKIDEAYNCS